MLRFYIDEFRCAGRVGVLGCPQVISDSPKEHSMHRFRATLLVFLTLGLLLNGCALPGQAQPTQAPVIIIASPVPQGSQPTAAPQPTAAGQAQPTSAGVAVGEPTAASAAPSAGPSGPA